MSYFDQAVDPLQGRTLISADPKDAARWRVQPPTGFGPPQINGTGVSNLDGYENIVMAGDVNQAELSEGATQARTRLLQSLESAGVDPTTIPAEQLKAASLALSGAYGPNATLTGISPQLNAAITAQLGSNYQGLQSSLRVNTSDKHPYQFLQLDGALEASAFDSSGGDYIHDAPNVDALTADELSQKEGEVRGLVQTNRDRRLRMAAPTPPPVSAPRPPRRVERATPTPTPAPQKKSLAQRFRGMFGRSSPRTPSTPPSMSEVQSQMDELDQRRSRTRADAMSHMDSSPRIEEVSEDEIATGRERSKGQNEIGM